jgi:hypothetical protein
MIYTTLNERIDVYMVRLSRLKNSITSDVHKLEVTMSQDKTLYNKSVEDLCDILYQYQKGIQLILSSGYIKVNKWQNTKCGDIK